MPGAARRQARRRRGCWIARRLPSARKWQAGGVEVAVQRLAADSVITRDLGFGLAFEGSGAYRVDGAGVQGPEWALVDAALLSAGDVLDLLSEGRRRERR